MTDELRQAAERLRRVNAIVGDWDAGVAAIYGVSDYTDASDLLARVDNDRYELSQAYLTEHAADDVEMISRQSLNDAGLFERERIEGTVLIKCCQGPDLEWYDPDQWSGSSGFRLGGCWMSHIKTIAQVRRLIAALEGR